MAFNKIVREQRRAAFVTELRYAVTKTPNGLSGRIKMPPELIQALGWKADMRFDVYEGDGEDKGWFSLTPVEAQHRAKLRVQNNGVGVYSSSILVPAGVLEKRNTSTPEARIDEETNTLYVKLS
jgi:hypothetical protein